VIDRNARSETNASGEPPARGQPDLIADLAPTQSELEQRGVARVGLVCEPSLIGAAQARRDFPNATVVEGDADVADLFRLLDEQQRVDEAAQLGASYLGAGGDADRLIAVLGACLLREDRNFHTIQCVEAAVRQHELLDGEEARLPLIAAARYLAAHAPTARSQRQTYDIARRLHEELAPKRVYRSELRIV